MSQQVTSRRLAEPRDDTHDRFGPAETTSESTAAQAVEAGGSSGEAMAGLGVVVLAILGLSGVLDEVLTSIAVIAAGAGLLLRGTALAGHAPSVKHASGTQQAGLAGGLTTEIVGGGAGVALGVLALVDVQRMTLLEVALIALGGALLLGGSTTPMVDGSGKALPDAVPTAAGGGDALIGIGAGTLGILALVGVGAPLTLVLAGLLAVGAGLVLESTPMLASLARR